MNWEFLNEKWVLLFEIGPGKSVVPSQHSLWLSWAPVCFVCLILGFSVCMGIWSACICSMPEEGIRLTRTGVTETAWSCECWELNPSPWRAKCFQPLNHLISSSHVCVLLVVFFSVIEPKAKNLHLSEANKTVHGGLELAYPTPSLTIGSRQQLKLTCHFTLKICGSTVISQKVTSVFKLFCFIKNFGWSYVSYGSNRVQLESPSTKEDSALRKDRSEGMRCQWGRTDLQACIVSDWTVCLLRIMQCQNFIFIWAAYV